MTQPFDQGHAPLEASLPPITHEHSLMLPQSQSTSNLPDAENPKILGPTEIYFSTPELSQPPSRSPHRPHLSEFERSQSSSARLSSSATPHDRSEDPRQIILRSFAPRIAVYTSTDAESFITSKGFGQGLKGLLMSFGERIQGKVIVRDSVGASRGWEDFGIRFVDFGNVQHPEKLHSSKSTIDVEANIQANGSRHHFNQPILNNGLEKLTPIDALVEHQLRSEDGQSLNKQTAQLHSEYNLHRLPNATSSVYLLYLRKLLSSLPFVPYETFSHPVACVIAVSSHSPEPIEVLRQLYANTSRGGNSRPTWVGNDYLRYYVLIHDEENDDITKSTALFDLMKRHFGLNCHLLRLRSSECVETDDDSIRVPPCEWLSAEEELAQIQAKGSSMVRETRIALTLSDHTDSVEISEKYILESDATAIRSFLREMVTQSVIPFMEGRVVTWNDQVASRRRGIGGRFMSLSKRWTGFGSGRGTASTGGSLNPSRSNYDSIQGFYPPETPEATMRQLADYAFMLRDWKLAYSTYEILRTDFGNDKAWGYHAAANEMAAVSFLLIPQSLSSRSRSDTVDQLLEAASYSYLTRCSIPYGVIRCITVALELLRSRGSTAAQDAARWGGKLLELGVLSPFAQAFLTERMADCYKSRTGAGLLGLGSRKRQTAFWSLMAAESWTRLGTPGRTQRRLQEARISYGLDPNSRHGRVPFPSMQAFWGNLEQGVDAIDQGSLMDRDGITVKFQNHSTTNNENEQLNSITHFTPGFEGTVVRNSSNVGVDGRSASGILHNNAQPNDDGFE